MSKKASLSLTELNVIVRDLEIKAIAEANRIEEYYKKQIEMGGVADFELDGYEACFILKPQNETDDECEEISINMTWHNIEIEDPFSSVTKTLVVLFNKLGIRGDHEKEELASRVTRVWMDVISRAQFMHEIIPLKE